MPEGYTAKIKVDLNGNPESPVATFDFYDNGNGNLATGETLLANPAPIILQYAETTGAPQLTFGTPTLDSTLTQVLVRISGGQLGAIYSLSCTAQTNQGNTRVVSGGIRYIGSR